MALVVVPDDQLSLAIGREGQNARLAAKLTDWRIDIKGSSEAARETLAQVEADPEIKEKLAGTVALVQAALQRHAEQQLPWNTDEMQQIKLLVDGQRHFVTARKRAEREQGASRTGCRRKRRCQLPSRCPARPRGRKPSMLTARAFRSRRMPRRSASWASIRACWNTSNDPA